MATFDYASIRDNKVIPNIIRFGQQLTITRNENTTLWVKSYDPVLMKYKWTNTDTSAVVYIAPPATIITYTGVGVLTEYEQEEIDGTNIKREDKKILTIDVPEPIFGDVVTIGGTKYQVIYTQKISPGGVDVLYKVQVRV